MNAFKSIRINREFPSLCFDVFVARCDFIYTGVQEKWLNDLQMNKYLHINYLKKKRTKKNVQSFSSVVLKQASKRKTRKKREWISLDVCFFMRFRRKCTRKLRGQKWRERNRTQVESMSNIEHYINTFGTSCTPCSIDDKHTEKEETKLCVWWCLPKRKKKCQ